jgi:lipopolysaccharide export system protein LptA
MRTPILVAAALVVCSLSGPARAQDFGAAFAGFNSKSDAPIQIEADRLEVRDAEKVAVYSGHVRVLQGDTLLQAPEMRVFYSGEMAGGTVAGSAVTRIEAGPGVIVRSGDEVATANRAIFDMAKNLITMQGSLILTKGDNVVRGERLVVNLTTKEARIEGGRVQTLITPPSESAPGVH